VWQVKGDGAAGEQHERERGLGRVKAVCAAGDEPDFVVERFGAALVDPEADRGEDPVAVFADRSAEADERFEAAAGQAGEEPVDQYLDVVDAEPGLEDPADGFLERVRAPDLAAGGLQARERGGLFVGELVGLLEQRPAGVLGAIVTLPLRSSWLCQTGRSLPVGPVFVGLFVGLCARGSLAARRA
jgi:hypothetical protein